MTTLLISAGAVIVALLAAFFKGRLDGAAAERAKQAREEARARGIHDRIDSDVRAIPPDAQRKELGIWKED